MADGPPGGKVGFTAEQRAAIRAVEEEATLDLIADFIRRAGGIADRLEAYAKQPDPYKRRHGKPGES